MSMLVDTAFYGKATGAEDFTWDRQVPPSVAARAARLVQVHIDQHYPVSAFLLAEGADWWVAKGLQLPGADTSGRLMDGMGIGLLSPSPPPGSLGSLLFAAYRHWTPARHATSPVPLEPRPPSPQTGARAQGPDEAVAAVLQLAVGHGSWAAVGDPAAADDVLAALPNIDLIAMVPGHWPSAWAQGVTLVVCRPPPPADERVLRLAALLDRPAVSAMQLGRLRELEPDPDTRHQLVLAARMGDLPPDAAHSPGGWEWLLTVARPLALARAPRMVVREWLQDRRVVPADLRALADRLGPADAVLAAEVLAGRVSDLDWFTRCFGRGAAGAERLLPPEDADVLASLRKGTWTAAAASRLSPFERAGLLAELPLDVLAGLHRAAPSELTTLYADALARAGLPPALAAALVAQKPLQGPPGVPPPTSGPPPALLPTVTSVGSAVCADRAWRRWWVDALAVQAPELAVGSTAAPWSEAAETWLTAAARDGEVTSDEALDCAARWRSGLRPDRLGSLLGRLGLPVAPLLEAAMAARAPPSPLTAGDRAALTRLRESGILTGNELLQLAVAADDMEVLASVSLDPGAVALVNLAQSPPVTPPAVWDARLSSLLARRTASSAFWVRWRGTLDLRMARWLAGVSSSGPGGADLAHVVEILDGDTRGDPALLERIAGAPEATVVLRQLARLSGAWDLPGRDSAVAALLASTTLREDIRIWLRVRLLSLGVCPVPDLTTEEMRLLLPLLHPIEDVVRTLYARPVVDPLEAALEPELLAVLARGVHVPPPPPDPAAAALRPRLTALLAGLPGWRCWKNAHAPP